MKDASVNASIEVILFDNNVMATINKLKTNTNARIWLALTDLNHIKVDHLKNRINAPLLSGKIIGKPNRHRPSYLLNGNTSPTTTPTDPALDRIYELELQSLL